MDALKKEMLMRKDYAGKDRMSTLYLGGGTPSFLEESELDVMMGNVLNTWQLTDDAECSVEMNPEDVNPQKLAALKRLGFNRLTIGVQSFNEDILKRINRTHNVRQVLQALDDCERMDFDNIGIDLILGLPGSSVRDLEKEFSVIKHLNISHISVYILSIDSNSVYKKLAEKGKFTSQDDDSLAEQYLMVCEYLKNIGFEHYEISNFAKDFKYSRHNTAYWQQKPYIGLGPAAHSFDIDSRQWNIAHLKNYIDSLNHNKLCFEREILTDKDKFNEYLMTNFRTMWGIDSAYLMKQYPVWWEQIAGKIAFYCDEGLMLEAGGRVRMTERGWLLSDGIFSELFI